jgi:hypothetical protein
MRWGVVLLFLSALGFGTGAFGRISSRTHVWPIGFITSPTMSVGAIEGATFSSAAPALFVDETCHATVDVGKG